MLAGVRDVTMEVLARSLFALELGRPVVDKTGLSGNFDFTIEWAREPTGSAAFDSNAPPAAIVGATPTQALRDQLGLKLEPAKSSLRILVVDGVKRPSEN